ncbi:alpha/beta fold hydrolase [Kitasatospora sp. CB01950]|uniref:alpha/beta fold hydrolase n=1 Tax=Kitasatospora sp. CB01950 TaxID=1703930 RepID=UPI0009395F9F|nr:alpha/beta hydrolase [Kitasatospora sp. CB01950]
MNDFPRERAYGMHVVCDGPAQAPPVLLVHGSGASGAFWGPVAEVLAAHHRVITVDLPGCGRSPQRPPYDVPVQAGRVAAVLDGLGVGPVVAVGHSSGGYVATALAERRPDLVRSLALVGTGPGMDALLPEPLLLRLLLAPPLGPLLWALRTDAVVRKGLTAIAARPVVIPDEVVAGARLITYRTFRAVLRANEAYLRERGAPERLAALGLPALVVFGTADPRWDPSSAHRYDAVARVVMLPGVGHAPMLEAPGPTAELLLGFAAADR